MTTENSDSAGTATALLLAIQRIQRIQTAAEYEDVTAEIREFIEQDISQVERAEFKSMLARVEAIARKFREGNSADATR